MKCANDVNECEEKISIIFFCFKINDFLVIYCSYIPSSPARLVEDITEIMNQEHLENSMSDSVYDNSKLLNNDPPNSQKRLSYDNAEKCGNNVPPKKAKKTFEESWDSSDIPFAVETPVCSPFFFFFK